MSPNLPQHLSVKSVRRKLRLSASAFYRHFDREQFDGGMVFVPTIVDYLNERRIGIADRYDHVPNLLSESDVASILIVDGRPATPGEVRRMCRRKLFPIPHVRFSRSLVRFPEKAVSWWLDPETRKRPVRERKFFVSARKERSPVR